LISSGARGLIKEATTKPTNNMTSVMASNQGLTSLLTEVSSIANYKKPTSSVSSVSSTALGSDTAAAALLLSDLSSIASYKDRRKSTNAIEQGVRRGSSLARHSYTVGTSDPAITINSILKENLESIKNESDNQQTESDPNNNSTAIYDVFDYSMSEIDLSEGPIKRKKSSSRVSVARKLDRLKEQEDDDDSISETYNVFDFSLSTVDPKLIDEPTPRKRVSRKASIGKLSEDQVAAARARTRRAGSHAKQTLKDKQQQQKPRQRPGMVRRNSFGSMRDLGEKKSDNKPKSPGGSRSHEKQQKELVSPGAKNSGRTRRVRGPRSGGRRASMEHLNQAQKQRLGSAVGRKQERAAVDEDKHKAQTVKRLSKIHQSFQMASMAAEENHTTLITACPDSTSNQTGAYPASEASEATASTKPSDLQTLSQGLRSSLSTLGGLKKKLLRSNTTGDNSSGGTKKKFLRSNTTGEYSSFH